MDKDRKVTCGEDNTEVQCSFHPAHLPELKRMPGQSCLNGLKGRFCHLALTGTSDQREVPLQKQLVLAYPRSWT